MSPKAVFWLVVAFLGVVDAVLMILSSGVGLVFLLVVILVIALLALLKPDLWRKIFPPKKPKNEDKGVQRPVRTMVLERCDTNSASNVIIDHSPFVIGRAADCDYQVENMPSVGRHHCRIIFRESTNNYYLEDLGSRNGTFLNALRLAEHTPMLLKPGSIIALDRYQYVFKSLGT